MKQAVAIIAFGGTALLGMQAWSDAPRHVSAHRLLNRCMSHEMMLSRTLSYNEAGALCKARLVSSGVLASPAVAAAFPPKSARAGGGSPGGGP